jgi:DNA-directed RNA polymerase specialized sigma24 family protein
VAALRTIRQVTREEALARLPLPYAVALRMRDAGASDELVADALGIDGHTVASLLTLADAKLATLLSEAAD